MPAINLYLRRCNPHFAGVLISAAQQPCIFDTTGMDVLSVQLSLIEGTWTNTIAKVRWSSIYAGPFLDYTSAITLTTSNRGSSLCAVVAKYAAIDVTTPEGSDIWMDAVVHMRPSGIGSAVNL